MVKSQSFDPLEFLRVAESLVQHDPSEASYRTAVNRIYYAVFLTARELLQVPGEQHIHGRVIGELRRRDRYASRQLKALHTLRGLADYHLTVHDSLRNDWHQNYQLARRLSTFVLERLP